MILAYLWCKKHKDYRAIRKPTADCEACRAIYDATNMYSANTLITMLDNSQVMVSKYEEPDLGR